jgi:hypothetical protein
MIWVAPTWSWASIIGKVQLHFGVPDKARKNEPKLLKMKVHFDGPDRFGSVKEATLMISGKLKPAFTRGESLEEYFDSGLRGSWSRRTGCRFLEFS